MPRCSIRGNDFGLGMLLGAHAFVFYQRSKLASILTLLVIVLDD